MRGVLVRTRKALVGRKSEALTLENMPGPRAFFSTAAAVGESTYACREVGFGVQELVNAPGPPACFSAAVTVGDTSTPPTCACRSFMYTPLINKGLVIQDETGSSRVKSLHIFLLDAAGGNTHY